MYFGELLLQGLKSEQGLSPPGPLTLTTERNDGPTRRRKKFDDVQTYNFNKIARMDGETDR